jgi:hypothetical protein
MICLVGYESFVYSDAFTFSERMVKDNIKRQHVEMNWLPIARHQERPTTLETASHEVKIYAGQSPCVND